MKEGYKNISVLDISEKALQNARQRLGDRAIEVNWIVSDVLNFTSKQQYDCWHDRAVFHFITEEKDIIAYVQKMAASIKDGGNLILATFSENGPERCSGLPIKQYSQESMVKLLEPYFKKIRCFENNHITPFNTVQSFTYCGFAKIRK